MIEVTEAGLLWHAREIVDLVLAKNHDYGDAWQKHGLAGVLVRISDKALRLENLEGKEALVVEAEADTLRDIAGYALLGLLRLEAYGDETQNTAQVTEPAGPDNLWHNRGSGKYFPD